MRRGFSLIELILASALLSMALVATFGIFNMGQRTFQYTSLRHGLQSEARRIALQIQQDVRLSHLGTTALRTRSVNLTVPGWESQGPQTLSRDGVCFASVRDWSQPSSIDPITGFPNYNCYLVYYATSTPEGHLIRQMLVPPNVGTFPFNGYTLNDNPASNSHALGAARILSRQVLSTAIKISTSMIEFEIKLRGRGGMRPGTSKQSDETYEISLKVKPENTYPKI